MRRCFAALAAVVALALPASAAAHAMPTSAVLLHLGSEQVTGEVELPLDRLAVAIGEDRTTAEIERYTRSHIKAAGAGGQAWKVAVSGGHVEAKNFVANLTLTPPDGNVGDFDLRYDVIVEQLVTHKAIVTVGDETLGVFDWNTKSLHVDASEISWRHQLVSSAGLGVQHIGEGADHLLFLLMLLIPAPLVARAGRWRRAATPAAARSASCTW